MNRKMRTSKRFTETFILFWCHFVVQCSRIVSKVTFRFLLHFFLHYFLHLIKNWRQTILICLVKSCEMNFIDDPIDKTQGNSHKKSESSLVGNFETWHPWKMFFITNTNGVEKIFKLGTNIFFYKSKTLSYKFCLSHFEGPQVSTYM